MTKRMMLALAMSVAVSAPTVHAQTESGSRKTHKKSKTKPVSQVDEQMREMRAMQTKMQTEIEDLKRQVADRDAKLTGAAETVQATQAQAAAATAKADEVSSSVAEQDNKVKDLQGQINDQQVATAASVKAVSDATAKVAAAVESPATLHFKGVTLTPNGFAAAETVFRSRALNSDINTPFGATVYQNSPQAYTSEFNGSGRQSRLGLLVNAPTKFGSMGAYYEVDFLSAGVTSNANQTNSYTLRQREAWAKIATKSGFQLSGGQMWSLLTEEKKGINPGPGAENLPNTIDPQYHVGVQLYAAVCAAVYAGARAEQQHRVLDRGATDCAGWDDRCAVQLLLRSGGLDGRSIQQRWEHGTAKLHEQQGSGRDREVCGRLQVRVTSSLAG